MSLEQTLYAEQYLGKKGIPLNEQLGFLPFGAVWWVDGDLSTSGDGTSPATAFKTISEAVAAAAAGDTIYVKPRVIAAGGTDPVNYAETIIIPAGKSGLKLIGAGSGLKQAAQPQIKKGSGAVALLTVRAPGCLIMGLTFNGGGATGGGILLDDNGTTKTAMGTIIDSCVFKNCKGSGATDGSTGGAVQFASTGGAWDTLIKDCLFYNNIGGVVLLGTADVPPQDLTIENCLFQSSAAASRDCDIWGKAGSGIVNLTVRNCAFGVWPAAGTKNTYMDLTSCSGSVVGCRFASTGKTFKAAGDVLIPATVFLAGNWAEDGLKGRDA